MSEVLDPRLWRERYAHNIIREAATTADAAAASRSELHALMCSDPSQVASAQEQLNTLVSSIPDDTIRWHLRAALSELELSIGIPMGILVVKSTPVDDGLTLGVDYDREEPRRPFVRSEQEAWWKIDLPPSVISIERVRAYWFDVLVWEISDAENNLALINLEWKRTASAHILPVAGSNLLITAPAFGSLGAGNYGALQLLSGLGAPLPHVWAVDYTLGPMDKHTGTPGQIEAAVAHWVYATAGILLLSIDGLSRSQGLTNASLSIDGLSRSFGLQASAIYGINSALENALEKATKRLNIDRLRVQKKGLRIRPFGH